jgi:hypothetical protein
MQKYSDTVATNNGATLEILGNASVTVYLAGTESLATIYSDNGTTPQANPFTADFNGRMAFYAADGRYDIRITKFGYAPVVLSDVLFEDPDNIDDDLDDITISNSLLVDCTLVGAEIDSVGELEFSATPSTGGVRKLTWNPDEETLDLGLDANVTLQLGQEIVYHVTNSTGSSIPNGAAVAAIGTTGNSGKILVGLAIANGAAPSKTIIGLATETISTGTQGFVTHFGKVRGIQTNGANYGEVWADGDILYASQTTPGALTKTQPVANGGDVVTLAIVIHAHPSNGTLFVRPTFDSHSASVVRYVPASGPTTNVETALRALEAGSDPSAYVSVTGDQTITGSKRGAVTTDNDLSFDMSASNNFTSTPSGAGTLTFTNITAGQSGFILLNNSGAHAISAAATTKVSTGFLAAVSTAGVYLLSYFSNGTNVYVVSSGALA